MAASTHPYSRIWTVLEWGRSHLGDRRAGCFQQPPLLKNLAKGRVWATRGRQLATTAESRHVTTRDNDSPKSTPLCNCHLALTPPVDNLLLFATTTGARHVFTRVRLGTHPCSRTRRLDVLDVLDGAKTSGLEDYVPLQYSSPFSVYSFRLAPHTSLPKNLDGRGRLIFTRAHIPAQELGRWSTPS